MGISIKIDADRIIKTITKVIFDFYDFDTNEVSTSKIGRPRMLAAVVLSDLDYRLCLRFFGIYWGRSDCACRYLGWYSLLLCLFRRNLSSRLPCISSFPSNNSLTRFNSNSSAFSRGTSDIELSYQPCQQSTAAHQSRPSIRCRQNTRDQRECV